MAHPPGTYRSRFLGLLCLLSLVASPAAASARFFRSMHEIPGIPPGYSSVEQDSDGFLWITSDEGLTRFDGVEAIPWGEDVIEDSLHHIATGPFGGVCAGARHGRAYEVVGAGVTPVVGPGGAEVRDVEALAWTDDDSLWIVSRGRVLRRSPAGAWSATEESTFAGEQPFSLSPARDPGGGVWAGTYQGGLWRIDAELRAHSRARGLGGFIASSLEEPDGSLVTAVNNVGVLRLLPDGGRDVLVERRPRAIRLARRGDSIWVSFADGLMRIGDDGTTEMLGLREGMPGSGIVFVDREGSLWLGTGRGLRMFPEPDARLWEEVEKARRVRRIRGGIWASTWGGPFFLPEGEAEWRKYSIDPFWGAGDGCVDSRGRAWMGATVAVGRRGDGWGGSALFRFDGPVASAFRHRDEVYRCACETDRRGSTWFVCNDELLRLGPARDEPELVGSAPAHAGLPLATVVDSRDTLHVLFDRGALCSLSTPGDWTCESNSGATSYRTLQFARSGELWAVTEASGLRVRVDGRWTDLPGHDLLRSHRVSGLAASPSGGVWVSTDREPVRLVKDGEGFRVAERLTQASGAPAWRAGAVFEDEDGSLWIPTGTGIAQVPAHARRRGGDPPAVRFTAVSLDGNRLPPVEGRRVPPDARRVELHFASLSFRDLGSLRYRMRFGREDAWFPLDEPVVRFFDPPPGSRSVQVAASSDGESWSDPYAEISFSVAPPWYMRPAIWGLSAAMLLWLLYVAHRMRAEQLLRVERERTRIAFDLHDEMGAAVGSIGIMAGVAAAESTRADDRREIAAQVAEAAGEVGALLHDIVWSLRGRDQRLGALAAHLTERGQRMFPAGEPRFRTDLPEQWPSEPLPTALQRNVQRIVVEAMHNVVRHARARNVELGFAPAGKEAWSVWVEDDGRGVGEAASLARRNGLGIDSMHQRAEEIGGSLRVGERGGGGTRVELVFDLKARRRRRRSRARTRGPGVVRRVARRAP